MSRQVVMYWISILVTLLMFTACNAGDDSQNDGDVIDGDVIDGDVTDSDVIDGDVIDGDVTDSDVIDGDVIDGDVIDGDVIDGDVTDGDVTDGDVIDGDVIDGDVIDGDVIDGDVIDGDVIDGDVIDGDVIDGDVIDGDVIDGDVIDGDIIDGDVIDGDTEMPVYFDDSLGVYWTGWASDTAMLQPAAETYCEALVAGGISDWRLPNITELRTLVEGCDSSIIGGTCGVYDDCSYCGGPESCVTLADCSSGCYLCETLGGPHDDGCYWPADFTADCAVRTIISSTLIPNSTPQLPPVNCYALDFGTGRVYAQSLTGTQEVICIAGPFEN